MKSKHTKYILCSIVLVLLFYILWYLKNTVTISDYLEPEIVATHYNGKNFVAQDTCIECHEDIFKSHVKTAHYNTSAIANEEHIKGKLAEGSNELNLKGVRLKLIKENDGIYQLTKPKFGDTALVKSKLDITIGSGVKGQSYLSWEDDKLYQLQLSYFEPANTWVNSPNFPKYSFNRPVDDNCLKCHVTFAENKNETGNGNIYNRNKLLLGIDCQRCHGPLEEHVVYHRTKPNEKVGVHVDNYGKYTQQQRLDACAVCHSGLQAQQVKGNPFSFIAGDTLSAYSKNYQNNNRNLKLDVHGNQMGLLSESKCFVNSSKMDCITCHSPHENERGEQDVFNAKCLSCHTITAINSSVEVNKHTETLNCISCHMPLVPSEVMKLKLDDGLNEIPVYIRTHLIGVY